MPVIDFSLVRGLGGKQVYAVDHEMSSAGFIIMKAAFLWGHMDWPEGLGVILTRRVDHPTVAFQAFTFFGEDRDEGVRLVGASTILVLLLCHAVIYLWGSTCALDGQRITNGHHISLDTGLAHRLGIGGAVLWVGIRAQGKQVRYTNRGGRALCIILQDICGR